MNATRSTVARRWSGSRLLALGDRIRFIDLEQVALGNGYTELAYLRTGFPTLLVHQVCARTRAQPGRSRLSRHMAPLAKTQSTTVDNTSRWRLEGQTAWIGSLLTAGVDLKCQASSAA